MCMACTSAHVDVTAGIERHGEVEMCRTCGKWLRAQGQWARMDLESAELLTLCVKRIRGLKRLHLVDASWIWTEPHSRRLKLRLTVSQATGHSSHACRIVL